MLVRVLPSTAVRRLSLLLLALAPVGVAAQQRATPGVILGTVSAADAGVPLVNAVVQIEALGFEAFTNFAGAFAMRSVPPGDYSLRVRRIGFTPKRIDVHVGPADTVRLDIALTHVAVRLAPMAIRARSACTTPGLPSVNAADPTSVALLTLFEQVRQNAEQYLSVSKRYPFEYALERLMTVVAIDSSRRPLSADTILVSSELPFKYRPGELLTRERHRTADFEWVVRIPTLVNFADPVFQVTHCFAYDGIESVDGRGLARIAFQAADSIKAPDVDGVVYLDTASFQIARLTMTLTESPPALRGVAGVTATTYFREVAPSVSVIDRVESVNRLRRQRGPKPAVATIGAQRMVYFRFLNESPSGAVPPPTSSAAWWQPLRSPVHLTEVRHQTIHDSLQRAQ